MQIFPERYRRKFFKTSSITISTAEKKYAHTAVMLSFY